MDGKTKIEIKFSSNECEVLVDGIPFNKKPVDTSTVVASRNLYVARREKRMKQTHVAKILQIHPVTYSRKERGELEFTLREAFILSDYFGESIENLFGYLR